MLRSRSSFKRVPGFGTATACVAVLLLAGAPAVGQDGDAAMEEARQRGELIATGGGTGGVADACMSCHGNNGEGDAAAGFPRLNTLDARHILKQLNDYADGSRPNDIMSPIAERLSPADREAVAVYYASVEPDDDAWRRGDAEPALIQRGGVLYAQGSAEDNIQACANCHGPDAEGLPPSYPHIAGQHRTYLEAQLHLWKEGVRKNDPGQVMEMIARNMSERDIEAAAAYLAELEP